MLVIDNRYRWVNNYWVTVHGHTVYYVFFVDVNVYILNIADNTDGFQTRCESGALNRNLISNICSTLLDVRGREHVAFIGGRHVDSGQKNHNCNVRERSAGIQYSG